jgi:hypothetical protein
LDFDYGYNIFTNGFSQGYFNYWDALALVQYLHFTLGYKERKAQTYLEKFSQEHDPDFNKITENKTIRTIVKKALKTPPEILPTIVCTKKELEIIRKIKNFDYQKILFTMLISAKRFKFSENAKKHNDYLGYHLNAREVHNICIDIGLKISLVKIIDLIREFYLLDLVDAVGGQNVRLLYTSDDSQPIIEVDGKQYKPWLEYVKWLGGDILFCKKCGVEIKRISPNQQYCEDCKTKK